MIRSLIALLRRLLSPKKGAQPTSLVLLISEAYRQTEGLYAEAATKAFGVPYDGSDEMHCVIAAPQCAFLKAGPFLISILPNHGAYLAETGEYDTATGANLIDEDLRAWWHMQRAWTAFDLQNNDVEETAAIQVLAKLALPFLDSRCCGVWIPSRTLFLPNDGRALAELTRLSQS